MLRIVGFVCGAASLLVFVLSGCLLLPTCAGPELMPSAGRLTPGLDFEGGAELVYAIDFPSEGDRDEILHGVVDIVRARLDATELSTSVFPRGDRLVVQIAGGDAESLQHARDAVGRSARLELRVVDDLSDIVSRAAPPPGFSEEMESVPVGRDEPQVQTRYLIARGDSARARLAAYVETLSTEEHEVVLGVLEDYQDDEDYDDPSASPGRSYRTYTVRREVPVDGTMVADAYVSDDGQGRPVIQISFDDVGRAAFARLTAENVYRRIAIVLNDEVMSAPVVNEPITGGRAQITLGASQSHEETMIQAQDLAVALRAGALPSPITLFEETVVEPTYGMAMLYAIPTALTLSLFLLMSIGAMRYHGATLILTSPLLMVAPGLAFLAWADATVSLPLLLGVTAVAFIGLFCAIVVAEHIRRKRGQSEARARFHVLNAVLPLAAMVALATNASLLLLLSSGPVRGFAIGACAVAVPGAFIAFAWSLAVSVTFGPRQHGEPSPVRERLRQS